MVIFLRLNTRAFVLGVNRVPPVLADRAVLTPDVDRERPVELPLLGCLRGVSRLGLGD